MQIIHSVELADPYTRDIVLDATDQAETYYYVFRETYPKSVRLDVRLRGVGAQIEILILHVGASTDECEITLVVHHEAPNTLARVTLKSALFGRSKLVFRGMLDIAEEAIGADSYLLARAVLMSADARAEILPELEIKTNEVKASHGTSVTALDSRALFYLATRGVGGRDAAEILLKSFFGTMLNALTEEETARILDYARKELQI